MCRMLEILQVSVVAYVATLLMEEGMILSWWYNLIRKLPDILYKPLGGCIACTGGQAGLWYYLIAHFHSYSFFEHVWFIAATIFTVLILDKILNYGA